MSLTDHRVLYYDSKTCKPDQSLVAAVQDGRAMLNEYEKTLVKMGTIDTVSLQDLYPASP